MAINRYDQPAEAQFINTYVPIPFDDIAKVALLKQARIDEDLEKQQNMLATYSSFKTAPGQDERSRDQMIEEMKKDFASLQDQPGFVGFRQGLNNISNKWGTDTRLQNLKRNQATFDTMLADYNKAKNEGVPIQNLRDMEEAIHNYINYGEEGLRKRTGSGVLTSPGYKGYVNVREGWEKIVNDVKPSSNQMVYDDKTGMYKVTDKNAGVTLNALSAPFGIKWIKESQNGKDVVTIDHEDFSKNGFRRLMETPEGGQVLIDAKEALLNKGEEVTNENLMDEAYSITIQTVNSIMSERVQSDKSISIDADPYKLAAYKKSLEDVEISFTNQILMSVAGNKLKDPGTIDKAKNTLSDNIKKMDEELLKFKEENKLKEVTETYTTPEGKPYTRTFYETPDGIDMTAEYTQMLDMKENYQKELKETQNYESKMKQKAGLNPNYTPSEEVIEKAKTAGMQAVAMLSAGGSSLSPGRTSTAEEKAKAYQEAYDKALMDKDPNWKKYKNVLEENAKTRVEEVGFARFDKKSYNDLAEQIGQYLYTENVQGQLGGGTGKIEWVQDKGKPFNNKDYENIDNSETPYFYGPVLDPENGELKFMYRFKKKGSSKENPEFLDPVKVDAPDGAIELLIKSGKVHPAEVYLNTLLSRDALGVDELNDKINLPGRDSRYNIRVEAVTPAERSITGNNYYATFNVKDSSGKLIKDKRPYVSKQDLISDIIGYYLDNPDVIK